jgi:hypothetical protein
MTPLLGEYVYLLILIPVPTSFYFPLCLHIRLLQCTQVTPDDNIMGDQWEEACRAVAQSGFQCADGSDNKCYANTQAVRGSC